MMKKTEHMESRDFVLKEIEESTERVIQKLKKIEAIADEIYIKASMSNSLIVIRKIGEDKIDSLKEISD